MTDNTDPEREARSFLPPPVETRARHPNGLLILDEKLLGWSLPENLRWIDQNSKWADYTPCGALSGRVLQDSADKIEHLASENRRQRDEALARIAELEAVLRECEDKIDIFANRYGGQYLTLVAKITATLGDGALVGAADQQCRLPMAPTS